MSIKEKQIKSNSVYLVTVLFTSFQFIVSRAEHELPTAWCPGEGDGKQGGGVNGLHLNSQPLCPESGYDFLNHTFTYCLGSKAKASNGK